MIVDIGYFALLASLVLTVFVVVACVSGTRTNSNNLIQSVRYSLVVVFLLVGLSYLSLTYAFITDDFTVRFVADHSSTDLPLFYKFTAVWAGMHGSLLLWELMLSFFAAVVALRYHKTNREILPHTLLVLGIISLFLLFLLVGWSNPLARVFPSPAEGAGMNPLLQNPGMVYHPPALYLGYVGFSVPFAFAMGSLLRGKIDNEWILTTRRWSLFSWFFLTVGMVLGAQWAYVELGWGGYWAWDPVENASLMPWLTGTAFIHSVIVQEKRNTLKIWNMVLIIATFSLCILGTFITRSGILNSVHSFAQSNIGPAFLVFLAFIIVLSMGLLLARQSLLTSKVKTSGLISKENSFLLNNIVFTIMAFTVLYGTVFPLVSEAVVSKKLSIQAPFFNTIMAPLGILATFLMGVTHILGWKRSSTRLLYKNLLWPILATVLLMLVFNLVIDTPWQFTLLAGTALLAAILVVREWIRSVKASTGNNRPDSSWLMKTLTNWFLKDRRRRGGLMIHLGIVFFIFGVSGAVFNQETSFTFSQGETKDVGKYTLRFMEKVSFMERNAKHFGVKIGVTLDNEPIATLTPIKAIYPTSSQPMTEVAIRRSLLEDLYIALASINENESATVTVYINPLVNFIWGSMIFVTIGFIFSLSHKPVQLRRQG